MRQKVSRKRISMVSTRGSKKVLSKVSFNAQALSSSSSFQRQEYCPSPTPIASGLQFPYKLHCMLDNAIDQAYDDTVSWDGDNGFKVHNKQNFVDEIVPKYFCLTKYRSFQRMLNMWGFERVRFGPRKGSYVHKNFRQGEPELCKNMKCEKIKKSPKKSLSPKKKTTVITSSKPLQESSIYEKDTKQKETTTESSPKFEGMHFQLVSENLDKVMMEDEDMCLPTEDEIQKEKEEDPQVILPPLALYSLVHDFHVEDDFQLLDLEMQKV